MVAIVQLAPLPKLRFVDANGIALSGGKLFSYQAGTTTKQNTYTDSTGTTPAANPIILDSRGEAAVWTDTTLSYKFTLSPSTDTDPPTAPIWTVDGMGQPSNGSIQFAVNLASAVDAAKGAGLVGFDFSLVYAALSAGWADRINQRGYNILRQVLPSMWAAILNGSSTDDHTAAIVAGVAAATAAKLQPYFPGARWNYKPTTYLEFPYGFTGDGPGITTVYVDASAYTIGQVVWRVTGGNFANLVLREKTLDKTRAVMLQVSGPTTVNAAGGGDGSTFTGYINGDGFSVYGGLVCLDIGNMFSCTFSRARIGAGTPGASGSGGATGVRVIPNPAASGGYVNALVFINCDVGDNNVNWNVNPAVGSHGFTIINGGTERCLTASSLFSNISNLSFIDNYLEQTIALSPINITGCNAAYARFTLSGSNCDLTLGSNTTITIDGWVSGTNHLLGGDGTQTVSMKLCTFPSSGNSATNTFAGLTFDDSVYNGVSYSSRVDTSFIAKAIAFSNASTLTIASNAIAPIAPNSFVGAGLIKTITVPSQMTSNGGVIYIIPTAAFTTDTTGNVSVATTAVIGKVMTLIYDSNTAKWYPSY